jgi:hypothetical protein
MCCGPSVGFCGPRESFGVSNALCLLVPRLVCFALLFLRLHATVRTGLSLHPALAVGVPGRQAREQERHHLLGIRAHGVLLRYAGQQGADEVPVPGRGHRQSAVLDVSSRLLCRVNVTCCCNVACLLTVALITVTCVSSDAVCLCFVSAQARSIQPSHRHPGRGQPVQRQGLETAVQELLRYVRCRFPAAPNT